MTEPIKRPKTARRVIHFSDGVIEDYSTDEEDLKKSVSPASNEVLDPHALTWTPWVWYWLRYGGSSALAVCDQVGETLANFFGITSPKYQYEIEEYKRTLEEEKEEAEEMSVQMAGWNPGKSSCAIINKETELFQGDSKFIQVNETEATNCNQKPGTENVKDHMEKF